MYRILIADDEALEREGMEWIIQKMLSQPCEVIHAENGREAIQKTLIFKPHIIFMDIRMPGIDGLEALKSIKEQQPHVKMVLITAYEYFDYAKEAIQLGVKDYIIKPAKRNDIVKLLEKLFIEIDTEHLEKITRQEASNKISQFTALAKTELALGLMSDHMSEEALYALAELIEMPLSHCCSIVVAFPQFIHTVNEFELFINKQLKQLIPNEYEYVASTIFNNHMAIFMAAKAEHSFSHVMSIAQFISTKLYTSLREKGIELFIGIGNMNDGIAGIKRSYFEAVFASTNVDSQHPICLFEHIEQRATQPLLLTNANDAVYVQRAIEQIRNEREHQTYTMIDRVIEYINKNYNRELSLEETAEYVHLNPYYFSKVFKQQTGETFIDYLTKIRIQHAKKWMQQKDMSIKEICYLIGYNDPNYFSRVFKKVVGQTPSEYRANQE